MLVPVATSLSSILLSSGFSVFPPVSPSSIASIICVISAVLAISFPSNSTVATFVIGSASLSPLATTLISGIIP